MNADGGPDVVTPLPPNTRRRIRDNLAWLLGDRLGRAALNVVVVSVVARYLGPDQFGLLNYTISLAAIFATVATLGFEGIVIRELLAQPEEKDAVLGTACALRFAGGLLAIALVALTGLLTRNGSAVLPLALVVSLGFLPQALEVIDLWFQQSIQSRLTVLAKSGAALLGAGVKLGLVWAQAPLAWFAAAVAVDAVLAAAALAWMFHGRGERLRQWRVTRTMTRTLLRDSWPLIVSGLLIALYLRVEQLLVMNWLGERTAGVYFAAVKFAEAWAFAPGLIVSSVYPLLVQERQRGGAEYERQLQLLFDGLTGLGLLVAVGVTFAGPWVLPLIFGDKYAAAVPVLVILGWTAPITFSGAARAQLFLLEKLTIYHTWSALIGIAANVGLALWLMPHWGAPGAALGALGGYWLSACGTSLLFPRLRPWAGLQARAFLLPLRPGGLLALWKRQRDEH